jgi:DNA end-binding protein Ku
VARAMWKGAIQFGLVTIPVKLYLATESKSTISFNLLHKEDLSRIQMKIWCPVDEAMIERSDTVRGYEYAPGDYVVITDDDLDRVPLKTVRSIEIEQFVEREANQGAVRFVKQAYYLEPDKIGRKAFALLRTVLAEQRLTAICKVVIKDREALAALDPFEGTMMLSTLHWPDEIRAAGDLDLGDEEFEFKPAEKAMASQLVAAMTGEFDPTQYRDEYREAVRAVIEAKVEGRETVAAAEPDTGGKLIDLMAALEASVKATTAARDAAHGQPVSVGEAKARRAGRAAKGSSKPEGARETAETEVEERAGAVGRPTRKRKTA